MPVFPAFRQRLNEIDDPAQRRAAATPMQTGGLPMRPQLPADDEAAGSLPPIPLQPRSSISSSPMADMGDNPMQMDTQQQMKSSMTTLPNGLSSSGTGDTGESKPRRSMVDVVRENVAKAVRYEDIAPKMETVPGDPKFGAHDHHGILDRLKAMLVGAGMAGQGGNGLGAIGGAIGGLVNPGGVERAQFNQQVLPRARQEQQAVMTRNASRQKQVDSEIQSRERLAKVNEMGEPKWGAVPGAEYPTLYDQKSGTTKQVLGPDGKPQRSASVYGADVREEVARQNREQQLQIAEERVKANAAALTEKLKAHSTDVENLNKAKAELEKMRQAGQDRRLGKSEAGRNNRASQSQAGADRRSKVLSDKEREAERKKRKGELPPGVGDYGPTALPPTSGTSSTSGRRQLPPPSGTSPN